MSRLPYKEFFRADEVMVLFGFKTVKFGPADSNISSHQAAGNGSPDRKFSESLKKCRLVLKC
jgi:hypothetical protein